MAYNVAMTGEQQEGADSIDLYGQEPELGPGHIEVSKLFPAFDRTKTLDENLKALRQYVLESVSPFNRAQFVLLVQLAILVYYPSVALSIVYSEYQEEIMQQQMIQDEEEQIELEQRQEPQLQPQQIQSTQEMKQLSMIQSIDQDSTKQSPLFQLAQLLQRVISQFIVTQSQEQAMMNQDIMMQPYQMQSRYSECIQSQQQQQYNCYYQQQTQQFQQIQMQQANQRQTQEEAQSVRNNENGRVHITVVIRLSGEERQGQQAADGANIIYQNYIIMF